MMQVKPQRNPILSPMNLIKNRSVLFIFFTLILTFGLLRFSALKDHMMTEREKVFEKKKGMTLSFFIPNFENIDKILNSPHEWDLGELNQYLKYYKQASEYYPEIAEAHAMLGYCYYYQGAIDQATKAYEQAVLRDPEFFWHNYNLGVLYLAQEKYLKAANSFHKAIVSDPVEIQKRMYVSKIYRQMIGRIENVEGTLRGGIRIGYENAHQYLLESYLGLDRYDMMMPIAMKAIKSNFTLNGSFSYYAGIASYQLGKEELSLNLFKNTIEKKPDSFQAYNYLGKILIAKGQQDEGKRLLLRSSQLKKSGSKLIFDPASLRLRVF